MKDSRPPAIRAMQTRSLLGAVRALPVSERQVCLASVEGAIAAQIDRSIAMSWMPMELHMKLSDATRAVIGQQRFIDLFEQTMMSSWSSPLLNGFVKMSTTLLGVTPSSLIQRTPYVYSHVTQNLGSMEAEHSSHHASIRLRGFPANLYDFQCYVDGTRGCLRSLYPLTHSVGTVEVSDVDLRRGDCLYDLRW